MVPVLILIAGFNTLAYSQERDYSQEITKLESELKSYDSGGKADLLEMYLGNKDAKDLLRFLEQSCELNKMAVAYVTVNHLRRLWKNNAPYGTTFVAEIENKEKNELYRLSLLSELTSSRRKYLKIDEKENITNMLTRRLQDKKDAEDIRAKSALALALIDKGDNVLNALTNHIDDESDKVSSQSIFGLKILKNSRAIEALLINLSTIIKKGNLEKKKETVRVNMVTLGRFKEERAIDLIRQVINETSDRKIFGSAVHALGLMQNEEVIEIVLDTWDKAISKFNNKELPFVELSCWAALRLNEPILIDSLNNQNTLSKLIAVKSISKAQKFRGVKNKKAIVEALKGNLVSADTDNKGVKVLSTDYNFEIRKLVISTLGEFRDPGVKNFLIEFKNKEIDKDIIEVINSSLKKMGVSDGANRAKSLGVNTPMGIPRKELP